MFFFFLLEIKLTGTFIFEESIGRMIVAGCWKRGLFGVGYWIGLIKKIGCACGALRLTKVVGVLVCAVFIFFLLKNHLTTYLKIYFISNCAQHVYNQIVQEKEKKKKEKEIYEVVEKLVRPI